MPFEIVRNDITRMRTDAIVNAANPRPIVGYGVDSGIHKRAGAQLLAARKRIGDIPFGDAAVTPAFDLDAKYVIHAVSPVWVDGMQGEAQLLERCYTRSLELALEYGCESIAFPLLSAGNQGFPKELALQTAISAISSFLMLHEMQIYLVVFDRSVFALSEKLFQAVKSFIDEHYIHEKNLEEYDLAADDNADMERLMLRKSMARRRLAEREYNLQKQQQLRADATAFAPAAAPRKLEDLINEMDESFSESLLRLIDRKGLTDPEVYKKANIDRKLFNKIKNNKDYKPGKATCLAFAIALELNLDETRDLIGKAGYALTHSSKFDIIIEYFIREQNYNCIEINEVLFAFGQPMLKA